MLKANFILTFATKLFWLTMFSYQLHKSLVYTLESVSIIHRANFMVCSSIESWWQTTIGIFFCFHRCIFFGYSNLISIAPCLDYVMLMKSYQTCIHVAKLIKILVIPSKIQQIDRFDLILRQTWQSAQESVESHRFMCWPLGSRIPYLWLSTSLFIYCKQAQSQIE